MHADILKAILSMDAYNRGYNAGIELSGRALGNYTLTSSSADLKIKKFSKAYPGMSPLKIICDL